MEQNGSPIIVQPGAGRDLHAFGNVLSVMLDGSQTKSAISIMIEQTPPGGGPPLHAHSTEDEIFLVIEGKISYFVNNQWISVGPGGVVFLPRGAAHCYRNDGNSPSRHWIITTPSGFEHFFADAAQEFAQPGGPNTARIVQIHSDHGIQLLE